MNNCLKRLQCDIRNLSDNSLKDNYFSSSSMSIGIEALGTAHYANISVSKHQNPVRLNFGKIELGACLESLRPPMSIAWPIMAMAGL